MIRIFNQLGRVFLFLVVCAPGLVRAQEGATCQSEFLACQDSCSFAFPLAGQERNTCISQCDINRKACCVDQEIRCEDLNGASFLGCVSSYAQCLSGGDAPTPKPPSILPIFPDHNPTYFSTGEDAPTFPDDFGASPPSILDQAQDLVCSWTGADGIIVGPNGIGLRKGCFVLEVNPLGEKKFCCGLRFNF